MHKDKKKGKRDRLGIILIIIAVCFYFKEVIFKGLLFWKDDIFDLWFPWYTYVFSYIKKGIFPLWNHLSLCGYPSFSFSRLGFFSPLNLIFLFLPVAYGLTIKTILSYILGAIFMYLYMRALKVSWLSSIAASLIFIFSGPFIEISFCPEDFTFFYLPLILFCIERAFEISHRAAMYTLGAGLTLGIQCLTGHFQYVYFSVIFVTFYIFFRYGFKKDTIEQIKILTMIFLIGIGVGAIQIIPMCELLRLSFWRETGWSDFLTLEGLIRFVLPNFNPATLTHFPPDFPLWVGIVSVLLLFFAPKNKKIVRFYFYAFFISFVYKNQVTFFVAPKSFFS